MQRLNGSARGWDALGGACTDPIGFLLSKAAALLPHSLPSKPPNPEPPAASTLSPLSPSLSISRLEKVSIHVVGGAVPGLRGTRLNIYLNGSLFHSAAAPLCYVKNTHLPIHPRCTQRAATLFPHPETQRNRERPSPKPHRLTRHPRLIEILATFQVNMKLRNTGPAEPRLLPYHGALRWCRV